jgi:hypothetical protein
MNTKGNRLSGKAQKMDGPARQETVLNLFLNKRESHSGIRKTIFLVFSAEYQELTFVQTGLLTDLSSKFRCICIVPSEKIRDHLNNYFMDDAPDIHVYREHQESTNERNIRALLARKYAKNAGPYRKLRRRRIQTAGKPIAILKSTLFTIAAWIIPEWMLVLTRDSLFSDASLDALFRRHRPVLAILSWGGVYGPCPMVIRSAKKAGCKTISADASWDCMDELSVIPKVDRLLVWNGAMKAEAVTRHRYNPDDVMPVGLLRCDFYRRNEYLAGRETFFENHGFEGNRKLVTLAVNGRHPETWRRVVHALLGEDGENRPLHPIQVYVRLAPWSDPADFKEFELHPHVTVRTGYRIDGPTLLKEEEIAETVNLLRHTDVLVSVLSTLILESVCFDTPNISLRFEEFRSLYERDCMAPLFEMGGVAFADDIPRMIEAVNRYLSDRAADKEGRSVILQRLCNGGNGKVKTRVLNEIVKMAGP